MDTAFRIIDGYNVTECENDKGEKRLTITFFSNKEPYIDSKTYNDLSSEKVQKIKEKLFDMTDYNKSCESISQVYALLDILFFIDQIVSD